MHVAANRHATDHRCQRYRAGEHGGHRQGIDRPARLHLLLAGRRQRILPGVAALAVAVKDIATPVQQPRQGITLPGTCRAIRLKMHAAIGTG